MVQSKHWVAMGAVAMLLAMSSIGMAQTPGGQTGGTSGGTGSASSNGGVGDAGGTGQLGVKTQGTGKVATTPPAAGSNAGNTGKSPIVGAGATGNGGVLAGTAPSGTSPASGMTPATGGQPAAPNLDGIASGQAPK